METQKCRKRVPRSVEFNFFINCDRQKWFSQNEKKKGRSTKVVSDFLIFAYGLSYDLSKFCIARNFRQEFNFVAFVKAIF